MANKHGLIPRPTINFGVTAATGLGERQYSKLINGKQIYGVLVTARARLRVLTNVMTLLRNRGSVFALFTEIGIEENGTDTMVCDGRVLRYLTEVHAPSTLTAVRGAVGIATYNLSESAVIWCAHPLASNPSEVTYIEKDASQNLQVFAKLNPLLDARLGTAGAGGSGVDAIVDTVSMTVEQIVDPYTRALPLYVPRMRQMSRAIAAANTEESLDIDAVNPIRGIVIQQDTSLGEVSDIIRSFALRAEGGDIIGPGKLPWDEFLRMLETEYGGAVYGDSATVATATGKPGGLGMLNFQRGGKLSNLLNPAEAVNLRFEFDALPSALAGATGSLIRLTILECARIPGLVAEQVPFRV